MHAEQIYVRGTSEFDGQLVGTFGPDEGPGLQGLWAWTGHPQHAVTSLTLTNAGVVILRRVRAMRSGLVNTVTVSLAGSAPTDLTNTFVGIYSSAGTLLGESADLSANWIAGTGNKDITLATAVDFVKGSTYHVAILYGAATTHPTLVSGGQAPLINLAVSSAGRAGMTSGTGLTALPASITLASATSYTHTLWAGVRAV